MRVVPELRLQPVLSMRKSPRPYWVYRLRGAGIRCHDFRARSDEEAKAVAKFYRDRGMHDYHDGYLVCMDGSPSRVVEVY